MPADFPPPRTLEFRPNNLPLPLTRFIGRERETTEAERVLAGTRLLTLAGPGGCGKTRLALQVATAVLPEYEDGVWLVELAALADGARVPQAAATVLGVRERAGQPMTTTLCEVLQARKLLLILDNCEHLIAACADLAQAILRACPQVRILATSREILDITGETVWRVPSLALPEPEAFPPDEETLPLAVTKFESVQLFLDRALLCQPAFAVTRENARTVAQVCRRLDGIPLAIELAAARVRVLSVEQIAARLDDRFRLLGAPHRGALPHQQTLRAAMDWSYDLLSEAERRLLGRLSVFAGGFTLEAAEEICAFGAAPGSRLHAPGQERSQPEALEPEEPGSDVLDLLTGLVNKSLVLAEEEATGEPRYRLLETIRQYGAEKLAGTGEGERLRERHRDWYAELVEEADAGLGGSAQGEWARRLERERDNVRAGIRFSLEQAAAGDTAAWLPGLKLGAALARFWEIRGYWSEGREHLARLLALPGAEAEPARAKALHGAGILSFYQGDYGAATALLTECLAAPAAAADRNTRAAALNSLGIVALYQGDTAAARGYYEQSLALRRELGDRSGTASTLNNLGMVAQYQGDYPEARTLYGESLALRRELGDTGSVGASLNNLGNVAFLQGDYLAAAALYEESLAIKRTVGDRPGIAGTLDNLGLVAQCRGDAAGAERLHRESLALRRELGDRLGAAHSLHGLGGVARTLGNPAEARRQYEESLAIARELGDRQVTAATLCSLARLAAAEGDRDAARACGRESLALRTELGDRAGLLECLEAMAGLAAAQGDPERGVRLMGAAAALRQAFGAPRLPMDRSDCDRDAARARAALGEAAFDRAWQAGQTLSLEAALAEAHSLAGAGAGV
jgi:predicted ATPase/Tfp pilus assembly protein PilF